MTDARPDGAALHVVVVAYGHPRALEEALLPLAGRYPITVVDNGSDEAVRDVAGRHGAHYVDAGRNLGFAAGVNLGVGGLGTPPPDVLLLNPDARIEADDVARLHDRLRADPGLGCVAPALRWPGAPAPAHGRWAWHTPLRPWAEAVGLGRRPAPGGFLSGAVLLLRGAALAEVGGLDERFFLYAEEEDWQRRAVRSGWRLALCEDVVAVHAAGGTEGDVARLQLRLHAAAERYVRKWYGAAGWALYRAGTVAGQLVRVVVRRGPRRAAARRLARLYLTGPDRAAVRAGAVPPLVEAGAPAAVNGR